jgi:hypothetical protein
MGNNSEAQWRASVLVNQGISFIGGAVIGFVWGSLWWLLLWLPYFGFSFAGATPYFGVLAGFIGGLSASSWHQHYWYLQELKRQYRIRYMEYILLGAIAPKPLHTGQDKLWCVSGFLAHAIIPSAVLLVANLFLAVLNALIPGIAFAGVLFCPLVYGWVHASLSWGGWNLYSIEDEIKQQYQVPEWFREPENQDDQR